MHPTAHLMIHNPSAFAMGEASELRDQADILDKLTDTYARAYASATGNSVARVRSWMDAETWMTAEEALALHFCDEVLEPEGRQPVACAAFDYTKFRAAPDGLVRMAHENGWAAVPPKKRKKGKSHA